MLKWFKWLVMPETLSVPASMEIEIYKNKIVSYSLFPFNSTNQKIRWSSADTSIATIDENWIISWVSVWETTITWIVDANWITESLTLTVTVVRVTWVTLNESSIVVNAWESFQLTATVTPSDAPNQDVTWSSSNTSVAVVDWNWLVTYVWDWNATITCTTVDGWHTATCWVACISFVPVDTLFWYTWTIQSITLKPHTYCLEVWWASWWNSTYHWQCWGKWWYSAWKYTISSAQTLYIYVWWQWCTITSASWCVWWWNWWWWVTSNYCAFWSWHMATWWWWTDISTVCYPMQLDSYCRCIKSNYSNRIIVAWWWWWAEYWAWWAWWWTVWCWWCWWTQSSAWWLYCDSISRWACAYAWWFWYWVSTTWWHNNHAMLTTWWWWYYWWWMCGCNWSTSIMHWSWWSWYIWWVTWWITCPWTVSFPSPSWSTETGHCWNWCVRIRSL